MEVNDIIIGCQRGERHAQSALYDWLSGLMYAVCLRYARDASEAEDMLQDGFIKVYQNIQSFKFEGSFEGWVRRIMVNTALERFRKKNQLYPVGEIHEVAGDLPDLYSVEAHISAKELMDLVRRLPTGYRVVFNLYAIEGYSHKEISEQLGISEGTSKSQLARARQTLQQKVKTMHSRRKVATKIGG